MSDENVTGALDGLVVMDLSTNLASAYTTLLFADNGAEVIQIERPGGSPLRRMTAWPFWLRGKKSVTLDLHDPVDLEVARSLAAGSDVVVESFGAGVADRLGLGYDALASSNPGLVYASISGFGHEGPFAHLKAYEAVVMAKTGSMYGNTARHRSGPVMINPQGATFSAALLAIQGTLVALHERSVSGHGQRVDATMVQGMLAQDPWSYFIKVLTRRYPDAFTPVGAPTPGRPVPTSWLSFGLLNGYSRDGKLDAVRTRHSPAVRGVRAGPRPRRPPRGPGVDGRPQQQRQRDAGPVVDHDARGGPRTDRRRVASGL